MVTQKGTIRYCPFFYYMIFILKTIMMKNYWKPTPKRWRKLGDSLLAVATIIAVGGIWQFDSLKELFTTGELKIMIISSIVLGVIGKFLTNFFKEDETPSENS